MAITLYEEKPKAKLTAKAIIEKIELDEKKEFVAVKYNKKIVCKVSKGATLEEVKEFLKSNEKIVKDFIAKVENSNEKRREANENRKLERKEMKEKIRKELFNDDYQKELEKQKEKRAKKKKK